MAMTLSEILASLQDDERVTFETHKTLSGLLMRIRKGPELCLCFNECNCTTHSYEIFSFKDMQLSNLDIVAMQLQERLEVHRKHPTFVGQT